jgi:hypothetical protein
MCRPTAPLPFGRFLVLISIGLKRDAACQSEDTDLLRAVKVHPACRSTVQSIMLWNPSDRIQINVLAQKQKLDILTSCNALPFSNRNITPGSLRREKVTLKRSCYHICYKKYRWDKKTWNRRRHNLNIYLQIVFVQIVVFGSYRCLTI